MAEKTRVLIVDDDVAFAESLSDILSERGYDIAAVNSGEESLKKAKEKTFDVILIDIKMPVLDGVETFKRLKNISPQTVVIMMTAYSVEELIKNALKEGAYGILYKPLDINKVVGMIERARVDGALVMVVDDDPHTRNGLKDILEEKGFVVSPASDGQQAIEIAKERPQDIVFIDMKLPLLNGLETYMALKKINPRITAVMITAYREETRELVEEALKEGAYICLYKPFNPGEALNIVEEITRKKKEQKSI